MRLSFLLYILLALLILAAGCTFQDGGTTTGSGFDPNENVTQDDDDDASDDDDDDSISDDDDDDDSVQPTGYGMCSCANSGGFGCVNAEVIDWDWSAAGQDVLDTIGLPFRPGFDLTLQFDYTATSGSCFQSPLFYGKIGLDVVPYIFKDCSSSGSDSITLSIPPGTKVADLSFRLAPGDYCGAVKIKSGEYSPYTGKGDPECSADVSWDHYGPAITGYSSDQYDRPAMTYFLSESRKTCVNTVGILNTWYQSGVTGSAIFPHPQKSPDKSILGEAIDQAHDFGSEVALQLYVDSIDELWRGYINPTDRQAWFASFRAYLIEYAALAEDHDVEILIIGAELDSMTEPADLPSWENIVDDVRDEFTGKVVYAPSDKKVLTINPGYWDLFDYVALTFWVSLGTESEVAPSETTFNLRWQSPQWGDWKSALLDLADTVGKKLFFAEFGYQSQQYCAYQPEDFLSEEDYNAACQKNGYEAFFNVWADEPDVVGVLFWRMWTARNGGEGGIDYTPLGKPAWAMFEHFFRGDPVE